VWTAPLSLHVPAGSFVTLVTSPTQATAFFRMILGLEAPRAGAVRVLGESPQGLRRDALRMLRRRVGSCLLPDGLMANVTLRANVALPLVFGDGRDNDEADATAESVLAHFGLAEWADARPSDLAPDTRQVASLARAVAARPELLLLHDPLTSVTNIEAVRLLTLCREYATTIVAAVHGEDEAVCMMADGSAVWDERGYREIVRT
jgi:ABC-type transporter Mla maintaining outer membrane lipid asymmetry ATPase subunit MlaF